MSFINKIIPARRVLVIDIGTYKVKVALCEYKNREVRLLGYGEKKQEPRDILGSEIANIEGVTNTIDLVIQKVLKNTSLLPNDIIVNVPTSSVISFGKKILYTRENPRDPITMPELDFIVGKTENQALIHSKREIAKKTGFVDIEMKLITSSITEISIDNFKVTNPLGFTGENVALSTLNIFIPASRYHVIQSIASALGKNILSIIPLEFSLPKIFESTDHAYDDILFLDIGNTQTSITIQKAGVIIGCNRIEIGMNDLIKNIKDKTSEVSLDIIDKIAHSSSYHDEKQAFLCVWEEGFLMATSEIIGSGLVPHRVFLSGGGNQEFIKDHIRQMNFSRFELHTTSGVEFLEFDFKKDLPFASDVDILSSQHLGLASMILASKEIIHFKSNPVFAILKNFIEKNEL